jgi:hypothetical protein
MGPCNIKSTGFLPQNYNTSFIKLNLDFFALLFNWQKCKTCYRIT